MQKVWNLDNVPCCLLSTNTGESQCPCVLSDWVASKKQLMIEELALNSVYGASDKQTDRKDYCCSALAIRIKDFSKVLRYPLDMDIGHFSFLKKSSVV